MIANADADLFQRKLRRLEGLLQQSEQLPDQLARTHVREVVQALLDLHGTGLARLLEIARAFDADQAFRDELVSDEVVSGLLVLHSLHPVPLEDRVKQALEEIRPVFQSHGCGLEFLGCEDDLARLKLDSVGPVNPGTARELQAAVEAAAFALAPELSVVEILGLELPAGQAEHDRFALPVL